MDPIIYDISDGQQLRINTIGSWLRKEYDRKIVKLSVDAGFTCPNRDGTKGNGGCLFCSDAGSGDHASSIYPGDHDGSAGSGDLTASIRTAIDTQIELLRPKWPDAGYIAYFQSNTNTYGPVDRLRLLYEAALCQPNILGIAIATRPDCLSNEVLDLLEELNDKTFLWVELGLQSIHEKTMENMNLCYTLADYDRAVAELARRRIRTVVHLILGLPGETGDMMLESVKYVCRPFEAAAPSLVDSDQDCVQKSPAGPSCAGQVFGLKLHMLNVVSDSSLPARYPGYVPFETIGEYTDLVVDALEIIPPEVTIHRLYGDSPRETLVAPTWARQKRLVLNEINKKLRDRDTWQGRLAD